MTPPPPVCNCARVHHDHGEYQMYHRHGCRCLPCAVAASEAKRRYNAEGTYTTPGVGFVDRAGTVRRIHALLAIGWRHSDISPRLARIMGRPVSSELITKHHGSLCFHVTADAVRRVYDALAMTPGPSQRNRDRAVKLGYAPPLAWDDESIDDPDARPIFGPERHETGFIDEIAVQEVIAGRPARLTNQERHEAVRRMTEMGLSAREIAARLGTTSRSVTRRRATTGKAAA